MFGRAIDALLGASWILQGSVYLAVGCLWKISQLSFMISVGNNGGAACFPAFKGLKDVWVLMLLMHIYIYIYCTVIERIEKRAFESYIAAVKRAGIYVGEQLRS